MPMSLRERIQEDMKAAMRSGEKDRLGTIRLILAAVKQREVDERISLDDAQVLSVLDKMGKQRRESIAQFQAGGRADLVAKENAELAIINAYMPDAELDSLINEAIAQSGAATIKDMGKVMGIIKAKAQGRADMAAVGTRIKARLS
jgi:uncharacterized protein